MTKPYLFRRFLAGLIDYSIVYLLFFVFTMKFGEPNSQGGYSISGSLVLIPMLFWFFIVVFLEAAYGATIGNSIVGLKPKSLERTSGVLSFGQSVKRHLLDPLDMFPFGIIGIIAIKNSDKHQRLGDIWAKTIVVDIPKRK
jgi:uncharacterized RDD family membrane protein YckC